MTCKSLQIDGVHNVNTMFLDVEADDLLPMTSQIWTVACLIGDETRTFHHVVDFEDYVRQAKPTRIVTHNGLGFDFFALEKVWKCKYSVGRQSKFLGLDVELVDTFLLSQFLCPDRFGGHGLANLGSIVGCPKMDFRAELIKTGGIPQGAPKGAEFKQYHPLMDDYCKQDVVVLEKIYHYLLTEVEMYGQ